MKSLSLVVCLLGIGIISANPLDYQQRPRRGGYNPYQAMMFSGGFYNPSYQGAMTAFANREVAATNTWSDTEYPPVQYPDATLDESNKDHALEEEFDGISSTELTPTTAKAVNQRPVKPKQTPQLEEESEGDDEQQTWPFARGGTAGQPAYNTFFPILFGSSGKSNEGGRPGAAIAIANSFSTGKGGVASSHATAYGDPYFSSLANRNNGNSNNSNKKQPKHSNY